MSALAITPEIRQKYNTHKSNAKKRGIEFDLTFDEWWDIWNGHFSQRGRVSGCMQMCRTGDAGGYELGNVRIDTIEANQKERLDIQRAKDVEFCKANQSDWLTGKGRHFLSYTAMRYIAEENPEFFEDDH